MPDFANKLKRHIILYRHHTIFKAVVRALDLKISTNPNFYQVFQSCIIRVNLVKVLEGHMSRIIYNTTTVTGIAIVGKMEFC